MNLFIFQSRSGTRAERDSQLQTPYDAGGDTDPATDTEETQTVTAGTKRKSTGLAGSASRSVSTFLCHPFILTAPTG